MRQKDIFLTVNDLPCVSLCFQVGDTITEVESVDEQWIMGVVGGKRGIVPKNYISLC